jgi:hypothetical protein
MKCLNCKANKCKAEENKKVSRFQDDGQEEERKTFEIALKGAEIMYARLEGKGTKNGKEMMSP